MNLVELAQIVGFFWVAYLLSCWFCNLFGIHPYGWNRTYACLFGAILLALIV
jgi:hypothetical protein